MPASPLAAPTAASAACWSAPGRCFSCCTFGFCGTVSERDGEKGFPCEKFDNAKIACRGSCRWGKLQIFFEGFAKETREAEVKELKRMKAGKARLNVEMQERKRKIRELDNAIEERKEDAGKKEKQDSALGTQDVSPVRTLVVENDFGTWRSGFR